MSFGARLAACGLACLAVAAQARADVGNEPAGWQSTWDARVYASLNTTRVQADSVLNPDNRLAQLPDRRDVLEARLDVRLESEKLGLHLRPVLRQQWQTGGEGRADEGYLSQWHLRRTLTDSLNASLGREVMNWGPAQFRSPSSPFYFDNGRADPTRELSGVDNVKLALTPDASRVCNLAFVRGPGHDDARTEALKDVWLLKGEQRGSDWTAGWVVTKPAGRAAFWGAYGQWTLADDWLLYGEAASSRLSRALQSPADASRPFRLEDESARHGVWLAGVNHTLADGQGLMLEYLFNGHGYSEAEAAAYFTRAASSLPDAAQALTARPALLGRHYLHAVWQSNLLEDGATWRLMWSANLRDGSREWAAYVDYPLNAGLNLYALGAHNSGGASSEFAALNARSLQVGLRFVMP